MPKTCIAVTTYKKNSALNDVLESIIEHNYHLGEKDGVQISNTIIIADDNQGESKEVFDKFNPHITALVTGPNLGIWGNKNRCIDYFLNQDDSDNLLLLDNDMLFIAPGMFTAVEEMSRQDKQKHVLAYFIDSDGTNGLFKLFPVQGETDLGTYHFGSHGQFLWYTRDIIEKIGYFYKFPYYYGFEHSEYSMRANLVQGYTAELYAQLKRSPSFCKLQSDESKNYELNLDDVYKKNGPVFNERRMLLNQGRGWKVEESNLTKKEEVIKP